MSEMTQQARHQLHLPHQPQHQSHPHQSRHQGQHRCLSQLHPQTATSSKTCVSGSKTETINLIGQDTQAAPARVAQDQAKLLKGQDTYTLKPRVLESRGKRQRSHRHRSCCRCPCSSSSSTTCTEAAWASCQSWWMASLIGRRRVTKGTCGNQGR